MEYEYPTLIADGDLKRLHVAFDESPHAALADRRKKCDFAGGGQTLPIVPFMEAVRLINEEGYRPCGNCLMEGGEISNWRERARVAEADVAGLKSELAQSTKLLADFKERAEVLAKRLNASEERLATIEGGS